jgi:hypothetical protein
MYFTGLTAATVNRSQSSHGRVISWKWGGRIWELGGEKMGNGERLMFCLEIKINKRRLVLILNGFGGKRIGGKLKYEFLFLFLFPFLNSALVHESCDSDSLMADLVGAG